ATQASQAVMLSCSTDGDARAMETCMTSRHKEQPPHPAEPDMNLLALFQSRLRVRSLYLGAEIRAQRTRLSAHAQRTRIDSKPNDGPTLARIQRAEQALAAVQQAQDRIG